MSTVSGASNNDWYLNTSGLGTGNVIMGKGAEELSMDDFFNLLVAQMTNQDMMNPTADTDYIAQMAQFTTLRGIQTIQEYQLSSYASSYAGKTVAIAHTSDSGSITRTEGVVESVTFYDGEPKVVVNGVSYPLYSVMEVKPAGSGSSGSGITQNEAAAYIGKIVTVKYTDEDDEEIEVQGEVTGVNTDEDGVVQVIIDDKEYPAKYVVAIQ